MRHEATEPGGLLIIETTNPDSDFPFGRTMHIDPTHLRAIYPEILKSMVESAGFEEAAGSASWLRSKYWWLPLQRARRLPRILSTRRSPP